MKLKFSFLISFLFIVPLQIDSQNSFQISLDSSSSDFWIKDLIFNENEEIRMISEHIPSPNSPLAKYFYLTKIPTGTGIGDGYEFVFPGYITNTYGNAYYKGDNVFIYAELFDDFFIPGALDGQQAFLSFNESTKETWARSFFYDTSGGFIITPSQEVVIIMSPNAHVPPYPDEDITEFFRFSFSGDTQVKKGIKYLYSALPVFKTWTQDLVMDTGENIFFNGFFQSEDDNPLDNASFILKTDKSGNPIIGKSTQGMKLWYLYINSKDDLFLLGPKESTTSLTGNQKDAILVKLDTNLNVIWSKIYHAEAFNFNRVTLNIFDDGSLVLAYSTKGAFPVILAKLTADGDIIWEKGYPLYQPEIDVMPDGSLLMVTRRHFTETGGLLPISVISKTDPNGDIEGCETFPACLEVTEIDLEFEEYETEIIDIEDLDTLEVVMNPYQFTFTEFCDIPPPPNPEFIISDTICINECIQTHDTYNHFAHGIEWQLTGTNTDSLLTDSLNFEYCFSEPGEYMLRQTVWFLGCDYSFEQIVTVLDDLEAEISDFESPICEETAILSVESNRPIRQWNWSTGDSISNLKISESGVYFSEVSDGFCSDSDTILVEFISEIIDGRTVLELPNDTVICEAHFPYYLMPESDFSVPFIINQNVESNDIFEINTPGKYSVGLYIEDCYFEKTFVLESDDCRSAVYFPNIFSPNDDGLNDLFFPQGTDFLTLKMSVYDRWGALIFESENENARWDGRIGIRKAPPGVYVYSFEFLNVRTGEKEKVSGDVTLVR